MGYTQEQFNKELLKMLDEANKRGEKRFRVISREINKRIVDKKENHRMPMACNAMWCLWEDNGGDVTRIMSSWSNGTSHKYRDHTSNIEIEFDTS